MSGGSSLPVEIFAGLDPYGAGKTDRRIRSVYIRLWRILRGKRDYVYVSVLSIGQVLGILDSVVLNADNSVKTRTVDLDLLRSQVAEVRDALARGMEQSGREFGEGERLLLAISWYTEHGVYKGRSVLNE